MNALRNGQCSRIYTWPRLVAQTQMRPLSSGATSSLALEHTNAVSVASPPGLTKGCLGEILRHGSGDSCVALNVGGQEFFTLRSTVNSNAVLAEHVARAESNHGLSRNSTAFIDRDPQHFGYILRHLRNRSEQSTAQHYEKASRSNKQKPKATSIYIDLPEDPSVLNELYIEAIYYRIPELQNALRKYTMTAHVSQLFKKQAPNPFEFLIKLFLQFRTGALAAGTVGGTWFITMQHDWEKSLRKWGWRD